MIAYNELGGYVIPNESIHRWAPQRILSGAVWEKPTIEYMIKHAGGGDIVHASTYFGDFLPGLFAGIAPEAKIWAFEPKPVNFRCAAMTVLLNGRKIAIMQLDVENFEKQGLSGALQLIKRCKPLLMLESVPEKKWFSEHIESLGYVLGLRLCITAYFLSNNRDKAIHVLPLEREVSNSRPKSTTAKSDLA